jgi:hypothetical protein
LGFVSSKVSGYEILAYKVLFFNNVTIANNYRCMPIKRMEQAV